MKVRFLHNRKTFVINTEQTFIGLSWQHAAPSFSLPNRIGKNKGERARKQQTRQSQNADVRSTDASAPQTFSTSGKESTLWDGPSYLRLFDRLSDTRCSITVSFPFFFPLQMFSFIHEGYLSARCVLLS